MPPIFPKTNQAIAFGDPEDADFPREFVTKSTAKLRQKNEKSKFNHTKRRKRLKNNSIKKSKKSPKMTFFYNVSNKGAFN